jgi:hypothetical protein
LICASALITWLESYTLYEATKGLTASDDVDDFNRHTGYITVTFARIIDFNVLSLSIGTSREGHGGMWSRKFGLKVFITAFFWSNVILLVRVVILYIIPHEAYYYVFYITIMPFSELALLAGAYYLLAISINRICIEPFFSFRNYFEIVPMLDPSDSDDTSRSYRDVRI